MANNDNIVLQIANLVRESSAEVREDLGGRIDAVGEKVLQQNSRIAKGETRDDEMERRLNVIEAAHRFVAMARPENQPGTEDFTGKDPVTGRDLRVIGWTLGALGTTGTFLWGVIKWLPMVLLGKP